MQAMRKQILTRSHLLNEQYAAWLSINQVLELEDVTIQSGGMDLRALPANKSRLTQPESATQPG